MSPRIVVLVNALQCFPEEPVSGAKAEPAAEPKAGPAADPLAATELGKYVLQCLGNQDHVEPTRATHDTQTRVSLAP